MVSGTIIAGFFIRACMNSISLSQSVGFVRHNYDEPQPEDVTGAGWELANESLSDMRNEYPDGDMVLKMKSIGYWTTTVKLPLDKGPSEPVIPVQCG